MFTRWGGFVYRRRRWLVAFAFVVAGGFGALAGRPSRPPSRPSWRSTASPT
jgi:hypothetical protein